MWQATIRKFPIVGGELMKAIHFKGANAVYGVGQEDYLDLPARKDRQ